MSRHTGSGGTTIRVVPRSAHAGPRIFIGRALYQTVACPVRVSLATRGRTLVIEAGDEYAVLAPKDGQPRISLGEAALERLTLDPGSYDGRVTRDGRIIVDLAEAATTTRPAGDWLKTTRKGAGLSRPALAHAAGVGTTMLQRWEDGRLIGSQYTALQRRVVAALAALTKVPP